MSARRTKAASPVGVVGVMALDRRGDRARQVPAAGEHAADQGVVDAELAALVVQPLLGRARRAVDLLRIARVGVHQHELADVVQQRGDEQAVAVRVAGRRRRAGRRRAGRRRRGGGSAPGAASHVLPRSKNSKVSAAATRPWTASGESTSTAATMLSTWPRRGAVDAVGEPQHGDDQRDVGLDGLRRRRPSRGAPRRPARARGCATRRAPGRARAPRRRRSAACRDPRCAAARRARTARRRAVAERRRGRGLAAERDGVMSSSSVTDGDLEGRGRRRGAPFSAYRQSWTNG